MESRHLHHFYINEEQSIYLLSHRDAQKLKDWLDLCEAQLARLGYSDIELIGKGAYAFVFAANAANGCEYVFKFSRITLPRHVQERLEEEGYMLSQVPHSNIPAFIEFQCVRGQSILMMERVSGINLEQLSRERGRLPARLLLKIAAQLADILLQVRAAARAAGRAPVVHGDIKPSNIVFNPQTERIGLIDWGAAVFAQIDERGQHYAAAGLNTLSNDLYQTNAKLGDIYFIGADQLQGGLSTPRFDEQGVAGTLYALASAQSSRFGSKVITANSLRLPVEFAKTLSGMLAEDKKRREEAGDYFLKNMRYMRHIVTGSEERNDAVPLIPVWLSAEYQALDTVVYSSRKSFLRREMDEKVFADIDATELDRYYKNYLSGMGDTEKAFITAVSRLGDYPVVGGLAIHWDHGGIYIDSSLNLYDKSLLPAFVSAVNNMVYLGQAICKTGVFKSCMFDARKTLHVERAHQDQAFAVTAEMRIPFEISEAPVLEDESRLHSYFEDGDDPDEMLELPNVIRDTLATMNAIHHTGCIIFESLEYDLKIHNYLKLLDPARRDEFQGCLDAILENLHLIRGLGVSGFMKLPYKDTKFFPHMDRQPDRFSLRDPKRAGHREVKRTPPGANTG
ncbi:phosphotransferase [Exilibacterium tricleocarpae]|uniref:Phosphotransferase n=1 Tax=Exilibacterium tricleocarpae TaxID=2591008 RepID=A0A545U5G8_9GAMM|nr:phosphotransferase [Exilibacterium tricleocarpae]TQV84711.1 phosphotransferase [Exilibacterium tricleocarpae]